MDAKIKQKLLIYSIVSGVLFSYLILVPLIGIGMPLYALLQTGLILYLLHDVSEVKNKKALLLLIPVFILSLNYFISSSYIFYFTNFVCIFVLYSTMVLLMTNDLNMNDNKHFLFFKQIFINIFNPFCNFLVPFSWFTESKYNKVSNHIIKKVILGLVLSIPCVIFVIFMLSSADMIFMSRFKELLDYLDDLISANTLFRIIVGIAVSFYLFGLFYLIFKKKYPPSYINVPVENKTDSVDINTKGKYPANSVATTNNTKSDTLVINIMLTSILIVYTMFIVIQFKYLFAGTKLPEGLTYAEYARKGFFELLFLSFINVFTILIVIYFNKDKIYNKNKLFKSYTLVAMLYLCFVTIVLLISSYYRMTLYNTAYGLTRLRILVVIFLVFEAIGLLFTIYYIIKPKFNIVAVYSIICLTFYLLINIINIDNIIAKYNIDMYYSNNKIDTDYLFYLSADAVPQIARLLDDKNENNEIKSSALEFIQSKYNMSIDYGFKWQNYNLSLQKVKKIYNQDCN